MLTTERLDAGVLAIDITGKLKSEHVKLAIAALEDERVGHDDISLLIDLSGYAGMTPAALWADFAYSLSHISELTHYRRIAVITGHGWITSLAKIENRLFRSIDIRTFVPDQREAAKQFALGHIADASPAEPHVSRLTTTRDDCLALRLTGPISRDDATAIIAILQHGFARHDALDLMVILDGHFSFDPMMLFSADVWKTKRDALFHLRHYAVVGAPRAISWAAKAASHLTPIELKTFDTADEAAAWAWLGAEPTIQAA